MVRVLIVSLLLFNASFLYAKEIHSVRLVCDEYPPYQTTLNVVTVDGFSVSVVKEVLDIMEVEISEIKVVPWARSLMMLKLGQSDILFSASHNGERISYATYSPEPLVKSPWAIWGLKKDKKRIQWLHDLHPGLVGVVNDYTYTAELWDFLFKENRASIAIDDTTNFKQLAAGRIKYAVAELYNGNEIVRKLKIHNTVVPVYTIKNDGLYVLFNNETISKEFIAEFTETLKNFKDTSRYTELFISYLYLH